MKVSPEETCGDEELLHGHHVHVGEVLDHKPLALVQVVVTSTLHKLFKCTLFEIKMMTLKKILTNAVVLLKVDNVLSNHDRVLDIRLHPFKALDTLVAGVPASISISLAGNAAGAEIFGDRGCSS